MKATGLGEEVCQALDTLEAAVKHAQALCSDVFVRLVRHRFPVGGTVDLTRGRDVHDPSGASHWVRVLAHDLHEISLVRPESTYASLTVMRLHADGSETGNIAQISVPVLGHNEARSGSVRERLRMLIEEMETAQAVHESGLSP